MATKKICINFGHGLGDPGAVSSTGLTERELIEEFGNKLITQIKNCGVEVVEVTDHWGNLPNSINATKADLCVSLHFNAFNTTSATGTEVAYWSQKGKELAKKIANEIFFVLGLPLRRDKGVYNIQGQRGSYLLASTYMPTVLLEPCFITNPNNVQTLRDNMNELAEKLATVIVDFTLNEL